MKLTRFPVLSVYDKLYNKDIEGVYLDDLIKNIMVDFRVDESKAYSYVEYERQNYNFTTPTNKTHMVLSHWPRKDINRYTHEINEHPKRCEATTSIGLRCSHNVNYTHPKYSNCTREKMICWQHCKCKGCNSNKNTQQILSSNNKKIVSLIKGLIGYSEHTMQALQKLLEECE
tara:strand:- start:116 stop:634 length:519 start_codon:yes stop_codon:yes gene_type:complete